MSAQVYSALGQTEGRKKTFLEWVRSNVNYYKSVCYPVPIRGNREQPGSFQRKLVSSPFN